MPIQYTVKTGDTVNAIAKRYNVPVSAMSGFRSNDPDVIFPEEILTIQTPQEQPQAPASEAAPLAPAIAPQPQAIPPSGAPVVPAAAPQQPPPAPIQPQQPAEAQPPTPQTFKRIFTTPSGVQVPMDLSAEADALLGGETTRNRPPTPQDINKQTETFFEQFGIQPSELKTGFELNPSLTLSYLVKQVMEATGLPDVRSNITNISKEIEDLANERDKEIQDIQDNPWKSAGSKQQLIQRISNEYENKIANRTNRLTLMQNAYQDVRQQVQFAATTAINLYDKERTFRQQQLEDTLDRTEKTAEIERKQIEEEAKAKQLTYSIQDVGGRTVRFGFDKEGKIISETDLGAVKAPRGGENRLSFKEAQSFGLPLSLVGRSEAEVAQDLSSATSPPWFRDMIQGKLQMSIIPEELARLWREFQSKLTVGGGEDNEEEPLY